MLVVLTPINSALMTCFASLECSEHSGCQAEGNECVYRNQRAYMWGRNWERRTAVTDGHLKDLLHKTENEKVVWRVKKKPQRGIVLKCTFVLFSEYCNPQWTPLCWYFEEKWHSQAACHECYTMVKAGEGSWAAEQQNQSQHAREKEFPGIF